MTPSACRGAQVRWLGPVCSLFTVILAMLALAPPAAAFSGLPAASRLASPSAVERVAVFGADDRVALPPSHKRLGASIGLLYEGRSQSVCTAFCVGDSIIATAAHCLYRTSGERAPPLAGFTFRLPALGLKSSASIAGARTGAAAQNVMAGSMRLSVLPPIDASNDWGLVRLAEPLCKGASLTVSRRPASELVKLSAAQRVYHVAFHRDFPNWQLAYAAPCAIRRQFGMADWDAISRDFSNAEEVVLHTCDTGGASSGSPLLIDGPKGPEVVGINVGTYVQSRVLMQNGEVIHRYKADTVANTGVAAATLADSLEAFAGAEIVASRARLRELQALLAAWGYYAGPRDGVYGASMREAIRAFERSQGRPETGLATETLARRLSALRAEQAGEQLSHHAPSGTTGTLGLERTSSGRTSGLPLAP